MHALAAGSAGCGGTTPVADRQPALPLSERTLENGDVPGFALNNSPAPLNLDGFVKTAKDAFVRITPKGAVRELTADGFSGAMIAVQQSTKTPAVFASTVVQLGSPATAEKVLSWVYNDSTSPRPSVCTVDIETFAVPGIPGAKGIKRSRAEDTDGAGPQEPFERTRWSSRTGPFLYDLITLGAKPGQVSQDTMLAAAQALYGRVANSPPLPAGEAT